MSEEFSLTDPTDIIASLSPLDKNQYGNTPIPGKSEILLLGGMQKLRASDFEGSEEKLKLAVEQAVSVEKTSQAQAETKTCLGYFYFKTNKHSLAEKYYVEAGQHWRETLQKRKKSEQSLLTIFLKELHSLYQLLGKKKEADQITIEIIEVLESNSKNQTESEAKELAGHCLSVGLSPLQSVQDRKKFLERAVSLISPIHQSSSENLKMYRISLQILCDFLKSNSFSEEAETRLKVLKALGNK